MEQLIEMARRLGRQIAAHERTTLLKEAQKAVADDADVARLVEDYQKQAQRIQTLETEQKPIEVQDKHKLADLEEKISTHGKLAELTRRQVDFVELMHKVKEAIDNELQMENAND